MSSGALRATTVASTATGGGATVAAVPGRPQIDLELTIDGASATSETTCTWAGAHVLTIHTAIPRADLAFELHSTFIGHAGVVTHAVHLRLGPPGQAPAITSSDHDESDLNPTHAPSGCAYEHAQRLIEILDDLGYRASINVPGERAFDELERAAQRPTF